MIFFTVLVSVKKEKHVVLLRGNPRLQRGVCTVLGTVGLETYATVFFLFGVQEKTVLFDNGNKIFPQKFNFCSATHGQVPSAQCALLTHHVSYIFR